MTIRIQQAADQSGKLPYPFFIEPDGSVGRQDVWKGRPERLVGFAPTTDQTTLVLYPERFFSHPHEAVGLLPVFQDHDRTWFTWGPATIESATVMADADKST